MRRFPQGADLLFLLSRCVSHSQHFCNSTSRSAGLGNNLTESTCIPTRCIAYFYQYYWVILFHIENVLVEPHEVPQQAKPLMAS
jgi:hypothetical protein